MSLRARGFDESLTFDFLVPGGDIGSRARSFCLEVWALRVAGGDKGLAAVNGRV